VNELVVSIAKARAYSPEGALLGTVGPRQISDLANLFEHHSAEVLEFELENGYTVTLDHEGTMVIPNIWFMARWDKLFGRLHYEAKPAANLIAEALRQRAELYLSMDYWLTEGDMRDASFIPKDDGDWQFSVEVKGDELADDEVSYHTEVQVRHNLVRVRPYRDLKNVAAYWNIKPRYPRSQSEVTLAVVAFSFKAGSLADAFSWINEHCAEHGLPVEKMRPTRLLPGEGYSHAAVPKVS
jgi:hypothetical protein